MRNMRRDIRASQYLVGVLGGYDLAFTHGLVPAAIGEL
jgi:hypothetical protein